MKNFLIFIGVIAAFIIVRSHIDESTTQETESPTSGNTAETIIDKNNLCPENSAQLTTTAQNAEYNTNNGASIGNSLEPNDNAFINNRLQTGKRPYNNFECNGDDSAIGVTTSRNSVYDMVVIVKKNGYIVRNAYVEAGDSYKFYLPDGTYQVFFYSGNGWNPDKSMPGGYTGGFVENESFSKADAVSLNCQEMDYELIPQPNGNFSTMESNASEIF